MRDGFIIHDKSMAQIDRLDNEQAGELLKAMIAHYRQEDPSESSQIVEVLMIDIAERMDADREHYEKVVASRSEAGKKGANRRWNNGEAEPKDDNDTANDNKPIANDSKAITNDNKPMANDNLSDSVSVSPKGDNKYKVECDEIIAYLNKKTGKHFRRGTRDTEKHIRARLADGFTVTDFKAVIDKKCAEWSGTKMDEFLRPQTLFGTKFESYLQSRPGNKPRGAPNRFTAAGSKHDYDFDALEKQLLEQRLSG